MTGSAGDREVHWATSVSSSSWLSLASLLSRTQLFTSGNRGILLTQWFTVLVLDPCLHSTTMWLVTSKITSITKPRFFLFKIEIIWGRIFSPRNQNREATSSEKTRLQVQILQWDNENLSLPSWAGPKLDISHHVPCFFFSLVFFSLVFLGFLFFSLVFLLSWAGLGSFWSLFIKKANCFWTPKLTAHHGLHGPECTQFKVY